MSKVMIFVVAELGAEMPRADDAGGRPALNDLRRPIERSLGGEYASRGLHDE